MGRKEGRKHPGTVMGASCIYKAVSMISLKENSDHVILLLDTYPSGIFVQQSPPALTFLVAQW